MRLLTNTTSISRQVKWTFSYPIILPKIHTSLPQINCQGTSRLEPVVQPNVKSKVSKFSHDNFLIILCGTANTIQETLEISHFETSLWGAVRFNPKFCSNHAWSNSNDVTSNQIMSLPTCKSSLNHTRCIISTITRPEIHRHQDQCQVADIGGILSCSFPNSVR